MTVHRSHTNMAKLSERAQASQPAPVDAAGQAAASGQAQAKTGGSSRVLPEGVGSDGHVLDKPVSFTYSDDSFPLFKRALIKTIERASGQRRMKRMYEEEIEGFTHTADDFYDIALDAMRLDIRFDKSQLAKVPKEGPVLFIANHPYGVLDGVTLTWLARQVRPDVKVLAHSTLCQIPSAQRNLLPIDFANTPSAQAITLNSRVLAQKWLRQGNAIGIFPGGGVATALRPLKGAAVDPPWHPFTAKMILAAKPTVIPIYFAGQNSRLFQLASHLSYTLRLSLMFFETARLRGSEFNIGVGDPIPPETFEGVRDRAQIVQMLRKHTLALANSTPGSFEGASDPDPVFHFPKGWG